MNKFRITSFAAAIVFAGAFSASGESYIYSPIKTDEASINSVEGSIHTTEISVAKGDTLYSLARRYIGKGIYYPQILLFNEIKDPNLIYTGSVIRVPVKKDFSSSLGNKRSFEKTKKLEPLVPEKKIKESTSGKSLNKVNTSKNDSESGLYTSAVSAYKRGECEAAASLFERFLNRSPDSPFASDAALYKADCYLKLSNQ